VPHLLQLVATMTSAVGSSRQSSSAIRRSSHPQVRAVNRPHRWRLVTPGAEGSGSMNARTPSSAPSAVKVADFPEDGSQPRQ
jgi:hypothetical protein